MGRQLAPPHLRVDGAGVRVQPVASRPQQVPLLVGVGDLGPPQVDRAFQLVQDGGLAGLVAVQLQAGVAHVNAVQPALDDLQRGHLFGHEQHPLALRHALGDQVGDGLGLARARRTLDHQVAARQHVQDGLGLRAVRVHHLVGVAGRHVVVQHGTRVAGVRGHGRQAVVPRLAAEPAAVEGPHDGVLLGLLVFGPGLGRQVLVDEQLAEREEAQVDGVPVHAPPPLARDGVFDLAEVVVHVQLVGVAQLRQRKAEVGPQLGVQRQVGVDLLGGPAHLEAGPGAPSFERHRHQHQRRPTRDFAGFGLVPDQRSQRQVQDVDALLFDRRLRMAKRVPKPRVQAHGAVGRLELVVHVAVVGLLGRGFADQRPEFAGHVDNVLGRRVVAAGRRRVVGRGQEVHGPLLGDQDAVDLPRNLVHDPRALGPKGTERDQRVAGAHVQQVPARRLDLLPLRARRSCAVHGPGAPSVAAASARRRRPRPSRPPRPPRRLVSGRPRATGARDRPRG